MFLCVQHIDLSVNQFSDVDTNSRTTKTRVNGLLSAAKYFKPHSLSDEEGCLAVWLMLLSASVYSLPLDHTYNLGIDACLRR